jgi:hypothetical protein
LDPTSSPIPSSSITFVGSDGVVRGVDATEVTSAQYTAFRKAVGNWNGGTGICAGEPLEQAEFGVPCQPDLPVKVRYCDARAYCAWSGRALCSATDWTQACTNAGQTSFLTGATLSPACASAILHDATATGCHGASPPFDAVFDLDGNVGEWTEECVASRPAEYNMMVGGAPTRCRVRGGDYTMVGKIDAAERLDCASDGGPLEAADFAVINTRQGFRCCEPPVCLPGEQRACYTGPTGTSGVGRCAPGAELCLSDGTGFGPCLGDVVPALESCATDEDDDCDGLVNEGGADCTCVPGTTAPCYTGPSATRNVGDCHAGTQICNAAGDGFGACTGEIVPAQETCATPGDESCNGVANELGGLGCICVPGTTAPCYEGPGGTADVGACKTGSKVCLAAGTGYGACSAQVFPTAESCANDVDDDCDGLADEQGPGQPCPGGQGFGKSYPPDHYSTAEALAVDDLGRAIVGGAFYTTLSLGGAPLVATSYDDSYLAAFEASGAHVWSRLIQGRPVAIAPVPGGAFVVSRREEGKLSARLSRIATTGADVWANELTSAGNVAPTSVAATPDGGVVAAFLFTGNVNLAGTSFSGTSLGTDALIAKYSSAGTPVWGRRLRGVGEGGVRVGVASTGTLHIGFSGVGDVDFGQGPKRTNAGREDICLGTFSGQGVPETGRCFGDDLPQTLVDFDVDPQGNVALVGSTYGAIDFGLVPIVCGQPPRFENAFLARFDATGATSYVSAGHGFRSVAFRNGSLVLATRDGFVALDAANRPVGAFLPAASPADFDPAFFDPPFFDARPDANGGVFALGGLSGAVTVDMGAGPLIGSGDVATGLLVRVVLP